MAADSGSRVRGEVWLGLLGPLYVEWRGEPHPIAAAKLRAILSALALRAPHAVSIDGLVDAVWPQRPPHNPRAALHTYVNRLRSRVGPDLAARLITTTAGYRADIAAHELDTVLFERHLSDGLVSLRDGDPAAASAQIRSGLQLWRGEPLADVPQSRTRDEGAARLAELRPRAWEAWVDAELTLGHEAAVVGELRGLVRAYPLRERFSEQLMAALYRLGQQGDALAVYRDLQAILREELGIDPSPSAGRLHERILHQDPSLRVVAEAAPATVYAQPPGPPARLRPAQLPADAADFTGRAAEVEGLRAALLPSSSVPAVGVITGPGGVGKTTIAVHVAQMVRAEYPDGQLYLDLGGTSASPARAEDLLAKLLRDLGVDSGRVPADPGERITLYRTLVAGRRLLLVLDDAQDAAHVLPLLPGGAGSSVLVTSRSALATLPASCRCELGPFQSSEALDLLGRIVGAARLAREEDAAREVVTACGQLPLAVRLAAARLLTWSDRSVRALADALADATRRLAVLEAENVGVRATFDVSYERLDGMGSAAAAFRLIGMWPGPHLSAEAVAAALDIAVEDATLALAELAEASLLTVDAGRFRAHDLLRSYAAERAAQDESSKRRKATLERLLRWCLAGGDMAARALNPLRASVNEQDGEPGARAAVFARAEDALAWFDAEAANLVAATRHANEAGLHDVAARMPLTMFDWFLRRLHYPEWIATHEIALDSARVIGDRHLESRLHNNLSGAYLRSWRPAEALASLHAALRLHRERGDRYAEAVTLSNIVNAYVQLERLDDAAAAAEEAIRRYREIERPESCGQPLIALGEIHRARGDLIMSRRYASEALVVSRAAGDRTTEGHALANLGHTALAAGQLEEASARYEDAIGVADADGDRYTSVEAREGLGDASFAQDDVASARQHWEAALAEYRAIGDERAERLAERLAAN